MDELFFLASKIGWAFLSPGNLLVFLLSLGVLFLLFNNISSAKKILIPTGLVAFVLMAYPVSDYLMQPLESRFSAPETLPGKVDGIIILGGGEDLKRSLSWQVAELGIGGDRYIGTASLATYYPNVPVIFTGGSGSITLQDTDGEGALARSILTTIGIQPERLIIESRSRNTYENFKFTKPLLPKTQGNYLLVTSAFHMPRAVGIARIQGVNVIPYPVDYRTNADELRVFDFDLFDHLKALEPAWREWIGLTVYYLTGKTSSWFPKPGEQYESKPQKTIKGFYSDQVN
ncbi:MAG: YdcF family protein [Pseudomonadota bacterium]|nr:YdcF family protein [Pseudomonadota bacterium]